MRIIITLLLSLIIATLGTVNAEIVEISLPELYGTYPINSVNGERTASFTLPQIPVSINGAWFRISGTTGVGSLSCEGGSIYPWPMGFGASMKDTTFNHLWIATEHMPEVEGEFGWTAQFQKTPSTTTWGFLMDGEAELTLFGAPLGIVGVCHPIGPPPSADVTEAVLIIDAEFIVPAKNSTWGRIKEIYNNNQ